MKGFKAYLLLALLVLLLIVFIIAGKVSPRYSVPVTQTIACSSVNLNFSYNTHTNITAPEGTNTFFNIFVNNTGNVTESISLKTTSALTAPFSLESAPSAELNTTTKDFYTEFGVYSPTKLGNYSIIANLSSSYLNCVKYVLIPIKLSVVNSSS